MAKTKMTSRVDIKTQVKRSEFIVGASTLVIAIALLSLFFEGKNALGFFKSLVSTKPSVTVVDTRIDRQVSTSPTPSVSKLSYTDAGQKYADVRRGDSYFRITKRICGTGKNYLLVSQMNGNRVLHPGESILISCF